MLEMDRWRRYWNEEPWGTHRDNLHMAVLAVELRKLRLTKGSKVPDIDEFLFKLPEDPKEKRKSLNAKLYAMVEASRVKK